MSIVFMFSGQGSQYFQMGIDLYQHNPIFRGNIDKIDNKIRAINGRSVLAILYAKDKSFSEALVEPEIANLAIYMFEVSMAKTLKEYGVKPDLLLGLSFGTIVASVIAKSIDEDEILGLLVQHAGVFRDRCEPGSMLGVLAPADIQQSSSQMIALTDLAGTNFENGCVLSMLECNQRSVMDILNEKKIAFQKLPVTRAFHSRWIDVAEDGFLALYSSLDARTLGVPLVCTSHKSALEAIDPSVFWRSIRRPMHFERSINELELSGPHQYIDVGPSGTLATFVKYIISPESKSTFYPLLSPFNRSVNALNSVVSALT